MFRLSFATLTVGTTVEMCDAGFGRAVEKTNGVAFPQQYVVVFFTLSDRASTVPSNTRGCQSGTWSADQKKIKGTSTKLLREHKKNKKNTTKHNRNGKKKGTKTKYTCQKKIEEGHSIERVWV